MINDLIDKALISLTADMPLKEIHEDGKLYLDRHYVGQAFGKIFYLHRFLGSDPDRGYHDHPWKRAWSIILCSFYFEYTRCGVRKVRWFNCLKGDTFHRVVLPNKVWKGVTLKEEQPCWTLFWHDAEDSKLWGFLTEIEGGKGAMLYKPYGYPKAEIGKQEDEWWIHAKSRRELYGN